MGHVAAFHVGLINAQSAKNKKDKIRDYIRNNRLDLLVVTETWTKPGRRGYLDLKACCPNIINFHVKHHQPRRNKTGGGVALLYNSRSNISIEDVRYSPKEWPFEYLDLDLNIHGNNICLIIIYSPN